MSRDISIKKKPGLSSQDESSQWFLIVSFLQIQNYCTGLCFDWILGGSLFQLARLAGCWHLVPSLAILNHCHVQLLAEKLQATLINWAWQQSIKFCNKMLDDGKLIASVILNFWPQKFYFMKLKCLHYWLYFQEYLNYTMFYSYKFWRAWCTNIVSELFVPRLSAMILMVVH